MKIALSNKTRSRINNFLTGLLIVVAACLLAWLSTRYEFHFDLTRNARHTLSAASVGLLGKMQDPITITAYAREDVNLRDAIRRIIGKYQRVKKDISLNFVNPDVVPDEVRNLGIAVNGELVIKYNGRNEHVQSVGEEDISNALQRLARGAERWLAFLEGHGERDPLGEANHDLNEWGKQLQNKGFIIQPINLVQVKTIPANTQVLVLAGPSVDLLPGELEIISDYIKQGGNLFWLADPGKQHGLDVIAEQLDISIESGMIIDFAGRIIGLDDPTIVMQTPSLYPLHPAIDNFNLTTFFPTATAISEKKDGSWKLRPLISTGDHTWIEKGKLEGEVNYDEGKDIVGPVNLGISLEREVEVKDDTDTVIKNQRIIVVGDGDFLSNTYVANSGNMALGIRMINWLSHDDALITISAHTVADTQLQLTPLASALIGFGFLLILPISLATTGLVIWWRRRKR